MTSTLQRAKVDLSGLMRVLSEALYSTPHVAIRELVQNAHDSCTRRSLEDPEPFTPQVAVTSTPGVLKITDNGAGLTAEEIHLYLSTVGSGYTRLLRERGGGEGLIGYFGLGFLSAFAVSERVEVWTCSYKEPQRAHRFISHSGETYTVDTAEPRPVGTEVRLTLRGNYAELGDGAVVLARLRRYCCLLRYPVTLNGGAPVNSITPPWRTDIGTQQPLSELRRRKLALEFAQQFEATYQPITTLDLPLSDAAVSGVLWIQDGGSYASSDNRNVSVFVRGMLISEDERDLLPRWAGFVGGVVEGTVLLPTASRESLQRDAEYARVAAVIKQALLDGLVRIARDQAATWRRILLRHNEALLGAALIDQQLFELVADQVTVPTTEGDLTLPALLERANGKVYVMHGDRDTVEAILFRALRLPVVLGFRYAALPFCKRYAHLRHGECVVLGTQQGDQQLFKPAELDAGAVQSLREAFAAPDRDVQVRAFDPPFLPFVVVTDRDAELKRRFESDEADRRMGQAVLGLARQFTRQLTAAAAVRMFVNARCPVVLALLRLPPPRRRIALDLMQPLVALMSDGQSRTDIEAAMQAFGTALLGLLEQG